MDRKTWVTNFWSRVDQADKDSCWPWKGHRVGQRGITTTPSGHKIAVHFAAWMLKNNKRIEAHQTVRPSCRNGLCCNPDHLSLVGRAHAHPNAVSGEQNGSTKLTDANVRELRAEYTKKGVTQQQLADAYGVSQGQVSRIVRRTNR